MPALRAGKEKCCHFVKIIDLFWTWKPRSEEWECSLRRKREAKRQEAKCRSGLKELVNGSPELGGGGGGVGLGGSG